MPTKTPAKKNAVSKSSAKTPAKKTSVKAKAKTVATSPKVKASVKSTARAKVVEKATETSEKSNSFFNLRPKNSTQENSQAVVIPCAFDALGTGTEAGPEAIREASKSVELFDEELWTQSFKIGIHTHPGVNVSAPDAEPKKAFNELYKATKPLVEFGKFPIVVGGDRSLTLAAVRACTERYEDLSVLQITAHASLRKLHNGLPVSPATVGYQLYAHLPQPIITQVGVRNISAEEVSWMEQEKPNINIYWARNHDRWSVQEIVSTLSSNVYLSIDVSGIDSALMPAARAAEPGGLPWYQVLELIRVLCVKRNVVAADLVDLAPIAGLKAPNLLCAKLLYKIVGYRFALDLGVTKKYV